MQLIKNPKNLNPRETTRIVYKDETKLNTINVDNIKGKEKKIKTFNPISKEEVQELWSLKNFEEKQNLLLKTMSKLTFMYLEKFYKRIALAKTIIDLDLIITDLFISSEISAKEKNRKEIEKANPFSIKEF